MYELSTKAQEARELFRKINNQVAVSMNNNQKKPKRGFEHLNISNRGTLKKGSSLYDKYKAKEYHKYNSRDILYYFKDLAKESGIRFVSNVSLDKRYMRNIKQLLQSYEIKEILEMYEFLFKSNQTYLKKETIQPGVLLSGWGNKIFDDSQLYKKGEFVNNSKLKMREYDGDKETSAIGDWGE